MQIRHFQKFPEDISDFYSKIKYFGTHGGALISENVPMHYILLLALKISYLHIRYNNLRKSK